MARRLSLSLVLMGLWSLSSCDAGDPSATSSPGSQAANTPIIASIAVQSEGNGIFSLQAIASDPSGSPLAFKWGVSAGSLLSNSQAAVEWKAPTAAGTIVATLQATDPTGLSASASQSIAVSGNGTTANSVGAIQTTSGNTVAAAGTTDGNGQITVPSPVGAIGQPDPALGTNLSPPFLAPAVSVPAGIPSPAAAILQPVATPKPLVSPPPLAPSPIPTPIPPTPQPGVPIPPPERWFAYDTRKIPVHSALRALDFKTPDFGWLAGEQGIVMNFNRTTPGVDPTLTIMNVGVPTSVGVARIHFDGATAPSATSVGFLSGSGGTVMRTVNGGQLWVDISRSLPQKIDSLYAMTVVNNQTIFVASSDGTVMETQSANAADPTQVNWTVSPTHPAANPAVWTQSLVVATSFPTQPNVAYFAGDGVYKLDTGAADGQQWQKLLTFAISSTGGPETADGAATDMQQISENEIWVTTSYGNLYRTLDAGASWIRMPGDQYKDREFNGNNVDLPGPSQITSLSVLDSSNAFMAVDPIKTYDTRDATVSWRQMPADDFSRIQMLNVITPATPGATAVRAFAGFGVSLLGDLWMYRSGN